MGFVRRRLRFAGGEGIAPSTLANYRSILGGIQGFHLRGEYPDEAPHNHLFATDRRGSMALEFASLLDRMEIFSPGKLPNLVTLENMSHTRWSRNPVIARTLIEFGWVRELNEGVKRIYEEMEGLYLSPPVFSEPNNAAVLLTLENNIGTRALRQQESLEDHIGLDVMGSLNEYEIEAVRYAMSRGSVTTKMLAEQLRKSSSLCAKTLKGLAEKGVLEWHGSSKNDPLQHYTLAEVRSKTE